MLWRFDEVLMSYSNAILKFNISVVKLTSAYYLRLKRKIMLPSKWIGYIYNEA